MLYNGVWTSYISNILFAFDADVSDKTALQYPMLYIAGQQRKYFSLKVFWKWIVLAWFHGACAFWIPMIGCDGVYDAKGMT